MARKPVSYFAGSVVIGTLIGALAGLLATPMAGRDVRTTLQRQAKVVTGRLSGSARLPGRFQDWKNRSRAAWGRVPASVLRRKAREPKQRVDAAGAAGTPEKHPEG